MTLKVNSFQWRQFVLSLYVCMSHTFSVSFAAEIKNIARLYTLYNGAVPSGQLAHGLYSLYYRKLWILSSCGLFSPIRTLSSDNTDHVTSFLSQKQNCRTKSWLNKIKYSNDAWCPEVDRPFGIHSWTQANPSSVRQSVRSAVRDTPVLCQNS